MSHTVEVIGLGKAYRHYPNVGFAGDRLSWDPVSCLVTVRGAAPWYQIVSGGKLEATTQPNEPEKKLAYLLFSPKA